MKIPDAGCGAGRNSIVFLKRKVICLLPIDEAKSILEIIKVTKPNSQSAQRHIYQRRV
jgi:hypothetical protein